jgi:4-amino-4-deoxy-L-arabinose transferase-like glycosyltransferase
VAGGTLAHAEERTIFDSALQPLKEKRRERIVLILLVMFFIVLNIFASPGISVTLDEPQHFHYGLFVLQGNPDRIDDSSMPVSALNAVPQFIGGFLPAGPLRAVLSNFFLARLVTILVAACFALLVFRWSRLLFGFAAAVFSTSLYVLDPNILAHSELVTTDVFAVGMITLSFYWLWKFAASRKLVDGLICAFILALSQLVKYTCVALFPLALITLIIHDLPWLRDSVRRSGISALSRYAGQLALYTAAAALISILVINIGFVFYRTFTPFGEYQLRSGPMQSLQAKAPLLDQMPVPVPYPYLQGLDLMIHTDQTADRYGNVYLLGRVSKPKGFPGYYFIASALKVPIATQLFIVAAIVLYFIIPRRRTRFFQEGAFFLVPFVLFTIYFNFFFNAQTGIRYYLVVFPLLYVLAGSLFADWKTLPVAVKATTIAMLGYLAVSVLSYFPYFTPYFNELVWDKTQTYKYLADSNLDWGQSRSIMERYLVQHPDAVYDPSAPQPGLLIIAGSDLVGILTPPEEYAWLRENFKPVDTVAFAYFVYRITPEEFAHLCATTSYCK